MKKHEESITDRIDRLLGGTRGGRAEMCRVLQIHPNTLHNWKMEGFAPRIDTLSKVANYLHVTPEYLWSGDATNDISEEDMIVLKKYKQLNEKAKRAVVFLINGFLVS